MTLADRIKESEVLIHWLDRRVGEIEILSETRFRLAGGCLDVALEHQKAIVLLIARVLYGPAFSIIRFMLEAYVRGVWLHQCASDNDLRNFAAERFERPFASLVSDIERLECFSDGVLSTVKKQSWRAMCSFTHTGFSQVVRRNKESSIEPNYDEDELFEALDFADAIALMSAIEISHLAKNDQLATVLLQKARAISKTPQNPACDHRPGVGAPNSDC